MSFRLNGSEKLRFRERKYLPLKSAKITQVIINLPFLSLMD